MKEIAKKQEKINVEAPAEFNEQFAALMNQMIEQKLAANSSEQ